MVADAALTYINNFLSRMVTFGSAVSVAAYCAHSGSWEHKHIECVCCRCPYSVLVMFVEFEIGSECINIAFSTRLVLLLCYWGLWKCWYACELVCLLVGGVWECSKDNKEVPVAAGKVHNEVKRNFSFAVGKVSFWYIFLKFFPSLPFYSCPPHWACRRTLSLQVVG